mmetsp:Transcript_64379/g.73908  ORF Transcript_64379/g.73908 Transcript_64379/m.73908 type:complete len:233 (+) Transcript_64379:124-822(+)
MSNQYSISFQKVDFVCHSCDKAFKITKNGEDFCDELQCKYCGSEFIEEKETVQSIPTNTSSSTPNVHHQRQARNQSQQPFGRISFTIFSEPRFVVNNSPFSSFGFGMPFMGATPDRSQFGGRSFDDILDYLMRNDPNTYGAAPAKEQDINSLQQIRVTDEMLADKESCAVCQDEYEKDTTILKLPCNHTFHQDCVKPWLKMHNSCPTCRAPIDGSENTSSQQHNHDNVHVSA